MSTSNGHGHGVRSIDAVRVTLLDGKERRFLLSQGGMRRLRDRFGVRDFREVLNLPVVQIIAPFLFEAMLDRGDMTEEQLEDIVSFHAADNQTIISEIIGVSTPNRPTVQEVSPENQ